MTAPVEIRPAHREDAPAWLALRAMLWGDPSEPGDASELEPFSAGAGHAAFVAIAGDGVVGLAEASLRHDYVNGTKSSPVGFLEAWSVHPDWRGRGIGRRLLGAVDAWARGQGCSELASDALLDNEASHRVHRACGFRETERVVYFVRELE